MRMIILMCLIGMGASDGMAQRNRRDTPIDEHPQAVGDQGIAWYTTWKTGLAEAQRSNRPIFFMAAATCSRGVSGAF